MSLEPSPHSTSQHSRESGSSIRASTSGTVAISNMLLLVANLKNKTFVFICSKYIFDYLCRTSAKETTRMRLDRPAIQF